MTAQIAPLDPDSERGRATAKRLTDVFATVRAGIDAREAEDTAEAKVAVPRQRRGRAA